MYLLPEIAFGEYMACKLNVRCILSGVSIFKRSGAYYLFKISLKAPHVVESALQ